MKRQLIFLLLVICFTSSLIAEEEFKIDLSGEWHFALDPSDTGVSEKWFERSLTGKIRLPGSLQEQGYGNEVTVETPWTGGVADDAYFTSPVYAKYRQPGNIKVPFWLQPEKHYVGVAWYQKEVVIPESWKDKYVEMELERTHWETTFYINGKEAGSSNALQTPHRYKISQTGKIILTIRVDNRVNIPVGINAHSVSDHTQSNWNGITGELKICAKPALHINNIQVYPNVKERKAKVVITTEGKSSGKEAELKLSARSFNCSAPASLAPVAKKIGSGEANPITIELEMGKNMLTWSEFEPNLYKMQVELISDEGRDTREVTFGMREFKANGRQFQVNNIPVFLRGTLECAIFPLTGYASMEPVYWEKIYRRCKEFGLNHVRFHSWCPPRVAFEIADKEGMYLQVECGVWANVNIGDGEYLDQWIYEEGDRILKEFGNHPSFCLMTHGNEPSGANQVPYLSGLIDHWKSTDPRKVYSTSGGWPYADNADYWNAPDPRIQHWAAGLESIINSKSPSTAYDFSDVIQSKAMPIVSHEIGQWCVYPDFKEMSMYKGVLKAKNFEIFQETLNEHHLGDLADEFLFASGRLQTLCYKADIEAALRTPEFAGFQLLDLHDFPGQGTALVGVLNPFWDTKGYVDGKEYSTFCNRTVPLVRMNKLVWTNNEIFKASVEISRFDSKPLKSATIEWELKDLSGKSLLKNNTIKDLETGKNTFITDIEFALSSIRQPEQLVLSVKVNDTEGINQWNIWVYPGNIPELTNKPYITSDYKDAIKKAKSGKNVLFCLQKKKLKPEKGGNIEVGFSSIFWNTAWTLKQAPHELGIYCNPGHPALSLFPNEGYSDYQWWDIVTNCCAMDMSDFPSSYRPVIHLIDDWFTNRKLGILFETKVGKGKLMVCSADLTKETDGFPALLQFKRSIENYMSSDAFNPSEELDLSIIKDLMK